ncbi:hypothetical protein AVEN_62315-1 [Araneus ventricosus]|uniref:Uncharacterized protein n=1 Tax=Araneus ventricosus TaxID=182803 RepID=A0A4Y2NYJ7_ARAVE|nr:hypothetical protein AVEN_62315-1 [Araneus ventricosus]
MAELKTEQLYKSRIRTCPAGRLRMMFFQDWQKEGIIEEVDPYARNQNKDSIFLSPSCLQRNSTTSTVFDEVSLNTPSVLMTASKGTKSR